MLTDRANAICLLEILKEYSDAQNVLPMREIIAKMNSIYGLSPDRRTIYSAISLLFELGYDISLYEENGIGYYLRNRDFEHSEILLLTSAVHNFPFISANQSDSLIEKLQNQISCNQRKKYKHLSISRREKKTDNRQVFWNIECLDEAIDQNKQVSFTYLEYNVDKKLHPRKKEPYIVNPYGMIYINEHYYLICCFSGCCDTSLYRIDRISNIKILDFPRDNTLDQNQNFEDAVYAFSGTPERIVMNCSREIISDIIDKFGTDVHIRETDARTISVSMTLPPHGIKFWALQYLPYVEVVEPLWLREEITESIRSNSYGV